MDTKPLPPQEYLLKRLSYNPETGELVWRERDASTMRGIRYSPERAAKAWNTKNAGKRAFTIVTAAGYAEGAVDKTKYYAHRIIWKMVTGDDPICVDHLNGDRLDNRFANLRAADRSINQRNRKANPRNTSGETGVYWEAKSQLWYARIVRERKAVNLGWFKNFDDAVAARRAALAECGYTERHGKHQSALM